MTQNFHLPPAGYGPGSQPDPDGELAYMEMPQDMRTFAPRMPEVEDRAGLTDALSLMGAVAQAARRVSEGGPAERFDLAQLDPPNRQLVAETMGEGEVAMKIRGLPAIRAQESVYAGIWVLSGAGLDAIEVAAVPTDADMRAFEPFRPAQDIPPGPGVVNAPPLLAELRDKSQAFAGETHVVNLTLLPHTESDLAWLDQSLGEGSTDILSRGYGNCRIRATALPRTWRVQFFNSMDTLILDTFEITTLPAVVEAAGEDLQDSGERLVEVLEAIR